MQHLPTTLAIITAVVALVLAIARAWHEVGRRTRMEDLKLQLEQAKLLVELQAQLRSTPSPDPALVRWVARLQAECLPRPAEGGTRPTIRSTSHEPAVWLQALDIAAHNACSPPVVFALFLLSLGFLLTTSIAWGVDLPGLVDVALLGLPLFVGPLLVGIHRGARVLHGLVTSPGEPMASDDEAISPQAFE